jgi:dGTPase
MKKGIIAKGDNDFWIKCFSEERYGVKKSARGERTEFERDYDRIIFSSAFRRLQNKTQVFPLPKHIFVHNRLTHSLEVASVGRSLGKIVGGHLASINEVANDDRARNFYRNHLKNVIASACLAHDLGNPAFGHSGEEAISKYFIEKESDSIFRARFSKEEWKDLTTFEGNANALRILTKQFNGRLEGGFRLTYSTLASILKYPCASIQSQGKKGPLHLKKYGFFQTEKEVFEEIAKKTQMIPDKTNKGAYYRHPFVYLVEAADDICYNIIDFEDAHRLNILPTTQVVNTFLKLIKLNKKENFKHIKETSESLKHDPNERIAYLRAKVINYLIIEAAKLFINRIEDIRDGKFKGSLYEGLKDAEKILKDIESVSYKKIYNFHSVAKIELAGFEIMSSLVGKFIEAALTPEADRIKRHKKVLELLPFQHQLNEQDSPYKKAINIIDFISGMTDLYALELYNNITGIQMPNF